MDECIECGVEGVDGLCDGCLSECHECGVSDRLNMIRSNGEIIRVICNWCRAHIRNAPHGRCRDCLGAKDKDGTCACRPPGRHRQRNLFGGYV